MTAKEYVVQHNQLMQTWINKYNAGDGLHPFAVDGILDPEYWFSPDNQEERILFVLKEAYDTGGDLPSHIDCSHLPAKQPYPRLWNLADYLYGRECTELCSKKSTAKCLTCRNFKGTYGNCVSWIYAIKQDDVAPDYTQFQTYCEENKDTRLTLLRKAAVINIKKANGKKTSNYSDLMSCVGEDRDAAELRKQIELINPTLIICGGTFAYFKRLYPDMPHLTPCKNYPSRVNYGYTVYNQRKIISMPHPSGCRWYPARALYEEIVANYKAVSLLCKEM